MLHGLVSGDITWRLQQPVQTEFRRLRKAVPTTLLIFALHVLFACEASLSPVFGNTSLPSPEQTLDDRPRLVSRTRVDPVLLPVQSVPEVLGIDLDRICLARYEDGELVPVPFQVDERTADGEWIFPFGKSNTAEQSNGVLDAQDVLLFMAWDAGARCPEGFLPEWASQKTEVHLREESDEWEGWVYVLESPSPLEHRLSAEAYIDYDHEKEELRTVHGTARFKISEDGLHTSFATDMRVFPASGGTGLNSLDRMKFRITIRFLFGWVPISITEESLGQDVVAYIQGPIRVVKRVEQFVRLPLGIRAIKAVSEIEHYPGLTLVPVEVDLPGGVGRFVSSVRLEYGIDHSPAIVGSMFRNSENPEDLVIDGRMSEAEQHFCTKQSQWKLIHGPNGAMMLRDRFPPELLEISEVRQGYIDDVQHSLGPERIPGSIGYTYTEVRMTSARPGHYQGFVEMYFPDNYGPGDEIAFLAIRDRPLLVAVSGAEKANSLDKPACADCLLDR